MGKNNKPVGEKAEWRRLKTRRVFRNKTFALRVDKVNLPGGQQKKIAYLERTDAVIIVPVTSEGKLILVRHYRYAIDDWELEMPAGGWKGAPNESLRDAAARELLEETGATSAALKPVGWFYSATSLTNEKCQVFLATGARIGRAPQPGPRESMITVMMPIAKALSQARAGKLRDGQSALALLLCAPLLREEERRLAAAKRAGSTPRSRA